MKCCHNNGCKDHIVYPLLTIQYAYPWGKQKKLMCLKLAFSSKY